MTRIAIQRSKELRRLRVLIEGARMANGNGLSRAVQSCLDEALGIINDGLKKPKPKKRKVEETPPFDPRLDPHKHNIWRTR